MANNIKQITNFDVSGASEVEETIYFGGNMDNIINYPYLIIPDRYFNTNNIIKFGYCANSNEGINYPIFITIQVGDIQETREIYLGKTGMYEFQPEEWIDVNDEEMEEEEEINCRLLGMMVPKDIPFCLDYCYSV